MSTQDRSTAPAVTPLTLVAADGYRLSAYRYAATGVVRGNLLMAGATGVPQRFYRRFAEHASAQGFNVLTVDYRGVGESKPASLKGFEMNYLDWATLDLAAARSELHDPQLPLFWVGHSFGGHAIGLLPNPEAITASYCFGSGAGWAGWMPRAEAFKVRLMWNTVLPLIVRWKGYMAWSLLGMGEDLPRGVYSSWRRWCRFPHYFFDDPAMPHLPALYDRVSSPCVFATSVDDPWAPPRSRDAFARGYRNAALSRVDVAPEAGEPALGHMGYFRASSQRLWDDMLGWFLLQAPLQRQSERGHCSAL